MSYKKLIIIFFIAVLPGLYLNEFFSRGESREALVPLFMIETGNFILPKVYNDLVPSKPPMLHWVAVINSSIFGDINTFTLRLSSVIFSVLAVFLLGYELEKRYKTSLLSFHSVFFTLFSLLWFRYSLLFRVDMVHSSSLFVALLYGFRFLDSSRVFDLIISNLFLALAFLAKGPIAVLLSVPIYIIFQLIIRYSIMQIISNTFNLIFSGCILALPWYLVAYKIDPVGFSNRFLMENVGRFSGTMPEEVGHSHGIPYLLAVYFVGLLPTVLFLAVPFKNLNFKQYMSIDSLLVILRKDHFRLFAIISIVVPILFYSIPSSKRDVYLLSTVPFFSYLVAQLIVEKGFRLNYKYYLGLGVLFILVSNLSGVLYTNSFSYRAFSEQIDKIEGIGSAKIYTFANELYGVSFYSKLRIFSLPQEPNEKIELNSGDIIIVSRKDLSNFENIYGSNFDFILESSKGVTKPNLKFVVLQK